MELGTKLLSQIEAQKASAAGLGAIIDDSVIRKARDFNDQWHTAVAAWDLQFKASLASILPLLVQLANIASSVISTVGSVGSFFSRALTPPSGRAVRALPRAGRSPSRSIAPCAR